MPELVRDSPLESVSEEYTAFKLEHRGIDIDAERGGLLPVLTRGDSPGGHVLVCLPGRGDPVEPSGASRGYRVRGEPECDPGDGRDPPGD
jgi:hypothetical protein